MPSHLPHQQKKGKSHIAKEAATMILTDTGPLVALFDPKDNQHQLCRTVLEAINEPLMSTIPHSIDWCLTAEAQRR